MTSLERLAVGDFAATIGTTYALEVDPAQTTEPVGTVELTLLEAVGRGEPPEPSGRPDAAPAPRQPFSLVFAGPLDPQLPQATYALAHERLGELAIFLVPIARDADGVRYEAVFG
jgi:hypothetical protein